MLLASCEMFRLSQFLKNLVTSLRLYSVLPNYIQYGQIFLVKCILAWFVAVLHSGEVKPIISYLYLRPMLPSVL